MPIFNVILYKKYQFSLLKKKKKKKDPTLKKTKTTFTYSTTYAQQYKDPYADLFTRQWGSPYTLGFFFSTSGLNGGKKKKRDSVPPATHSRLMGIYLLLLSFCVLMARRLPHHPNTLISAASYIRQCWSIRKNCQFCWTGRISTPVHLERNRPKIVVPSL